MYTFQEIMLTPVRVQEGLRGIFRGDKIWVLSLHCVFCASEQTENLLMCDVEAAVSLSHFPCMVCCHTFPTKMPGCWIAIPRLIVYSREQWMDGWIDGWLDGWMDGWTNCPMNGLVLQSGMTGFQSWGKRLLGHCHGSDPAPCGHQSRQRADCCCIMSSGISCPFFSQ